jgi:hypothetical protein
MCSVGYRAMENVPHLVYLCFLIVSISMAGCTDSSPLIPPDNLTLHLRCSSQCAVDLGISQGHVKVKAEELTRHNCSAQLGNGQVTIACPADRSQWTASRSPHHEYPAMPIQNS